jgi:two-component system alkaline phosphatase synthesis response regulator PhoP
LEKNKRVLIIDDEASVRRVMALKLENHGYQVITAANGQEGLQLILNQKPHVVITDLNMPKLDGKALCEKANNLKKNRDFLTIVITAQIPTDELSWINDLEKAQFMSKPVSPTQVLNCIDHYFNN